MRIRAIVVPAAIAALFAGCAKKPPAPAPPVSGLVVRVLDVGTGDAILLRWKDKAALVDGGLPEASDTVLADLRQSGVSKLDWVVATHPHADHIGGLPAVIGAMPVAHFLDSGFQEGSPQQEALLTAIRDRQVPFHVAERGETLDLGGGATLHLLGPPHPSIRGTRSDANNNSIVARLDYGTVRVLLTGDMEAAERQDLYTYLDASGKGPGELRADVLKCAHHGSRNGTDRAFLRAVRPKYAVISCATGNNYGHPHAAAIRALQAAGVSLYRTDMQGDVTFTTNGMTVQPSTARSASGMLWTAGDGQQVSPRRRVRNRSRY